MLICICPWRIIYNVDSVRFLNIKDEFHMLEKWNLYENLYCVGWGCTNVNSFKDRSDTDDPLLSVSDVILCTIIVNNLNYKMPLVTVSMNIVSLSWVTGQQFSNFAAWITHHTAFDLFEVKHKSMINLWEVCHIRLGLSSLGYVPGFHNT